MMKHFYIARINLGDELKKRENIQRVESLKKSEQEKENKEISIINSTKASALEGRKCRNSCQMSCFITKKNLNGEQLTDETINLALKIIKIQYSSWNGVENTAFGPIRQCNHHKKNFMLLPYSDNHWETAFGKSLNKMFMLPILVVA